MTPAETRYPRCGARNAVKESGITAGFNPESLRWVPLAEWYSAGCDLADDDFTDG